MSRLDAQSRGTDTSRQLLMVVAPEESLRQIVASGGINAVSYIGFCSNVPCTGRRRHPNPF